MVLQHEIGFIFLSYRRVIGLIAPPQGVSTPTESGFLQDHPDRERHLDRSLASFHRGVNEE
jgi:hypothetical protein